MAIVVEIRELRKTYRSLGRAPRPALDGFDMVVEAGQVHGFLGPNGSGKTTTLRTLLGLVRSYSGTIRLFGREMPRDISLVIGQVGAVVESPQFFANFSGRDTLSLLADTGRVPRPRVDEVLEQVGLADRAKDRVKSYSLGMRQRLAVASALLKNPRLLVLDEPTNGLDPGGIREMRDLMRELAANGMTVLLSSHILGEIQQICDSVTIISRGKRVTSGPVSAVLAQNSPRHLRVNVENKHELSEACKILVASGFDVQQHLDHLMLANVANPGAVARTLATNELYVSELTPVIADLETVFLELVKEDTACPPVTVCSEVG